MSKNEKKEHKNKIKINESTVSSEDSFPMEWNKKKSEKNNKKEWDKNRILKAKCIMVMAMQVCLLFVRK